MWKLAPTGSRSLLVLAFACLVPSQASGHSFRFTDVQIRLLSREFEIRVISDLDALALGTSQDADSAELAARLQGMPEAEFQAAVDGLKELIQRRIRLRIDGQAVPLRVTFPQFRPDRRVVEDSILGTLLELRGTLPDGVGEISFFASRAFPPVRLTLRGADDRVLTSLLLERGERSPPFSLLGEVRPFSKARVLRRYVVLGFTHILPLGLDHILFVLGLFLFRVEFRSLLWQISSFTLAHTLTLGLGIYGMVSLPTRPVEALIALSIVYVAAENITVRQVGRARLLAIFLFGLLHGLGFAGVVTELGLPTGQKALALFSFNLGVELGQIAVLSGAFLFLGRFRSSQTRFRKLSVGGSILIGMIGLFWFWQRLFGAG